MFLPDHLTLFKIIREASRARGEKVYVVGGVIRDILLGEDPADKDIDFIVEGDTGGFVEYCAPQLQGSIRKFPSFGTAKVIDPRLLSSIAEVDFAMSREESYSAPGALPTVRPAPIARDLERRDFTINALAVGIDTLAEWAEQHGDDRGWLRERVIDRYAGLADLDARIVRILHAQSFTDDPTRLFRGARYCVRVNGSYDSETALHAEQAIKGGALDTISIGRIANELRKIFEEHTAAAIIELLLKQGILQGLSLCPPGEELKFGAFLQRLDGLAGPQQGVLKYGVLLRYAMCALDGGPKVEWGAYGFGKKEAARFHRELKSLIEHPTSTEEFRDETVLFRAAQMERPPISLTSALHTRGISP